MRASVEGVPRETEPGQSPRCVPRETAGPGTGPRLSAVDLAFPPAPLPLRADLLGLRGRVGRRLRRDPRPAPGLLAPRPLQPVQPRRLRPDARPLHAARPRPRA